MLRGLAALLASLTLAACAASTAGGSPPNQAAKAEVTGGASCSGRQQQDLTFTGALSGHVRCATAAVTCASFGGGGTSAGLVAPIRLKYKGQSLLVTITVLGADGNYQVGQTGTFAVPGAVRGEGGAISPAGAGLDGPATGHWDSMAGGSVVVASSGPSGSGGTLDLDLQGSGSTPAHLSGSWSCTAAAA